MSGSKDESVAPSDMASVKEGLAYILVPQTATNQMDPKKSRDDPTQVQSVFYNPIQQFNRDLSVLAIKAFGEDLLAVRRKQAEDTFKRRSRVKAAKSRCKGQHQHSNGTQEDADDKTSQEPPAKRAKVDHQSVEKPHPQNGAEIEKNTPEQSFRWNPRFSILDALSATGLRALRYAKEIPFVSSVTANDLLAKATEQIKANAKHNDVDSKIRVVTGNALSHLYSFAGDNAQVVADNAGKYDVIDLDPYGTAVPFLDASLHALNDGGLLCVTCTDAGVWASNGYPEKAFALYGGTPLKGPHSHEAGLRLILHAIASAAARQGMAIEPILTLSIDYYARTFVRVRRSPAEVKFLAGKTMIVYNCDSGCGAWSTQFIGRNDLQPPSRSGQEHYKHTFAQAPSADKFCAHCGHKTHLAGPMWGGPLHNAAFIRAILQDLPQLDRDTYQTVDRIEGMLTTALEELVLLDPEANSSGAKSGDGIASDSVDQDTSKAAQESEKAPAHNQSSRFRRPIPPLNPAVIEKHAFFFVPSTLAKVLRCQAPSEAAVKGALLHAGYRVARSHTKPGTVKTTAPWSFVWRLMRQWVEQRAPIKADAMRQGMPGWKILGHGKAEGEERQREREQAERDGLPSVVFDEALARRHSNNSAAARGRLVRYQMNPRENWGPMGRARGSKSGAQLNKSADEDMEDAPNSAGQEGEAQEGEGQQGEPEEAEHVQQDEKKQ